MFKDNLVPLSIDGPEVDFRKVSDTHMVNCSSRAVQMSMTDTKEMGARLRIRI